MDLKRFFGKGKKNNREKLIVSPLNKKWRYCTKIDQLIFRKITKVVAIRFHVLKL